MTMDKCNPLQERVDGNDRFTEQNTANMTGRPADELDRNHFPTRLHMMLSSLEDDADGLASVVSWQPHGRVFVIRDADAFTDHVLPK
jgi:HSF-type DNA-binding